MSEFVLKYADSRGEVHSQVASATNEQELRERFSGQGFLIYSIQLRRDSKALANINIGSRKKKINLEKFLIFNQQFVTLILSGFAYSERSRPC